MSSPLLIDHETQKGDFRLMRLCEWAGEPLSSLRRFRLKGPPHDPTNTAEMWAALADPATPALLMGEAATRLFLGQRDLHKNRGYVFPRDGAGHVVATFHPEFIERGGAKWSAAFINDVRKVARLGREGAPPQFVDYTLDPLPGVALMWAQEYLAFLSQHPETYCAFDIETPGKGEDEDESDTDGDAPDRTWRVERIGFAYRPYHALSVPWEPPYMAAIRGILSSHGDKVVWNAGFDVPRVARAGIPARALIHDGMVAWHILHTDLPKRLGFVATFTCPWQPAWKHLSGARPAFYNATDADVELRSMLAIEDELRRESLWDVYDRDVLQLEPILVHMHDAGMPVDGEVRMDSAARLDAALSDVWEEMQRAVPIAARRIEHVYVTTPKDVTGLLSRVGHRQVPRCNSCGLLRPTKAHFKRFVRKSNPCADGRAEVSSVEVVEYYRLGEWTPSNIQLSTYHRVLNRPLPTVWDRREQRRKVSFGEKQLKELVIKYPEDKLYGLILDYRGLDKLAGTYVGRPTPAGV